MKSVTLTYNPIKSTDIYFHIYYHPSVQISKKTANMWEYKVGNNVNTANFVFVKNPNGPHGKNQVTSTSFIWSLKPETNTVGQKIEFVKIVCTVTLVMIT